MRFPEFTDEWTETSIGSVLTIGNGRDYKDLGHGDVPVFGTGGYMTSVNKFLLDGESVFIGRKGTINKPFYFNGKFWTVDTLFYTHSFKGILPKFVLSIFENINWLKYNEASGVPSLSKSTIEKIIICIPRIIEQQKISDFIDLLNHRIELQSKLIEDLQQLKSAICKKLLSRSSWNEYIIDDICDSVSFKEYIAEVEENGSFPIIQQGETPILGYGNKKPYYNYNSVIIFGDHTLSLYKPQVPFLVATDGVKMLSPKPFVTRDFLYYLIETFMPISQGYKRHFSILKEQIVRLPSLKEQTIIGKRLSLLDTKIRIEQQLYDCYISQKQYLLGQMFI